VRVDIDGHRVVGVTDRLADGRDLLAGVEEQGRERVAHVMEPLALDAVAGLRADGCRADAAPRPRHPIARPSFVAKT
jgi:hypothetical protein